MLHAAVGKVDFPVEHLHANLGALTAAILGARPKGIKGGGESCATQPVMLNVLHNLGEFLDEGESCLEARLGFL